MLVGILPTGKLELLALGVALKKIFPEHEFETIPKNRQEGEPFPGFTSGEKLRATSESLQELVAQMVASATTIVRERDKKSGRRIDKEYDLVIVVEDAELYHNSESKTREIVGTFRAATLNHMKQRDSGSKAHDDLRTKASFRIVMPMIEAWFFADPNGPSNAGALFPANWQKELDPEQFQTEDAQYLSDDGSSCSEATARKKNPAWLPSSKSHPKRYLSWLCRNPSSRNCSNYRETKEGKNALEAIDWEKVLSHPEHCTFLRSMIEDLRDGLGSEPAYSFPRGNEAECTSLRTAPANRVLRNI